MPWILVHTKAAKLMMGLSGSEVVGIEPLNSAMDLYCGRLILGSRMVEDVS